MYMACPFLAAQQLGIGELPPWPFVIMSFEPAFLFVVCKVSDEQDQRVKSPGSAGAQFARLIAGLSLPAVQC